MVYSCSRMKKYANNLAFLVAFAAVFSFSPVQAEKVLSGTVSSERVARLVSEINWQQSIDEAKKLAKQENKLILWVNMLGKLEGDT